MEGVTLLNFRPAANWKQRIMAHYTIYVAIHDWYSIMLTSSNVPLILQFFYSLFWTLRENVSKCSYKSKT
jgi:hypothetical protein